MPFWIRLSVVLISLVIFLGLGDPVGAASKLSVSPSNPRELKNSSLQFTASLNGELADGPVKWSSSSPTVATISGATGTANATLLSVGTTTITVVHGGQQASTVLTVTTAASPVFNIEPSDTNVGEAINAGTGVRVQLLDNLGGPLAGQGVTVSIGTNAADGGGALPHAQGTLSGSLTQVTNANGIVTFSDLRIDWLGNGYTLVASANPVSGPLSGTSAPFDELRVGDPCLGPSPACSSGCSDSDDDGLNDAWEIAGGVDLNGDGRITDTFHDVLLPGADPTRPDIYLKYDYMVAPTHSHQPPARAWDQMTAMFAAHGIALHVLAPAAGIPEHVVTTLDPNATSACAGTDFITMQQLRAENFGNLRPAYHYMVFAHDATTPHDGTRAASCPLDALCAAKPVASATGVAEILGNDAIVSFGTYFDAPPPPPGFPVVGIELWAATMMHELGHNFGLVHGSLADPTSGPEECLIKKPNYISVMNYSYQTAGIIPGNAPGAITAISCTTDADCGPPSISTGRCATPTSCFCTDDGGPGNNFCYRPDYAEDNLLNLNETTLDEHFGVGGASSLDDIVWYWNAGSIFPGPSNGSAIDWNNDGFITDLRTCNQRLPPIPPNCPDVDDNGTNSDQMDTTADWTQIGGQFIHLNFQFQCTAGFLNDAPGSAPVPSGVTLTPSAALHELSFEWARQHHILHPPRLVSISVSPGCSSDTKPVPAGRLGSVRVAVLGTDTFDVAQVDPSSLGLHGAKALSVVRQDVNHDGIPDLVATFDSSEVKLHPQATVGRLTGWLKSSQSFSGEDRIRVVPSLALEDPSCR